MRMRIHGNLIRGPIFPYESRYTFITNSPISKFFNDFRLITWDQFIEDMQYVLSFNQCTFQPISHLKWRVVVATSQSICRLFQILFKFLELLFKKLDFYVILLWYLIVKSKQNDMM